MHATRHRQDPAQESSCHCPLSMFLLTPWSTPRFYRLHTSQLTTCGASTREKWPLAPYMGKKIRWSSLKAVITIMFWICTACLITWTPFFMTSLKWVFSLLMNGQNKAQRSQVACPRSRNFCVVKPSLKSKSISPDISHALPTLQVLSSRKIIQAKMQLLFLHFLVAKLKCVF